ncbi:MAG: hypothetical protein MHMPM18_001231 [Marteilia pararefringens]
MLVIVPAQRAPLGEPNHIGQDFVVFGLPQEDSEKPIITICAFLTEKLPDDRSSIQLYFGCNNAFTYVGFLSNSKPSGIYKINRLNSRQLSLKLDSGNHNVSDLSIVGKFLQWSQIEMQQKTHEESMNQQKDFSQKIVDDLYQYFLSFSSQFSGLENLLETWYQKIVARIAKGEFI